MQVSIIIQSLTGPGALDSLGAMLDHLKNPTPDPSAGIDDVLPATWRRLVWPILLGATFLVELGNFWGNFYLDDYFYLHIAQITHDPFVFFYRDLWFGAYFRPGFFPLFYLDYLLFGLHPAGYLLSASLLVLGTVAAWYALVRRWFGSEPLAFWSAFLFGVSPVTMGHAHFICNTTDVMGGFLLVLSLYFFQHFLPTKNKSWLLASLAAGLWAMLCKENQVAVVAFTPLLAWSFYHRMGFPKRPWLAALKASWPMFGTFAIFIIWRSTVLGGFGGYLPKGNKLIDPTVIPIFISMLDEYFLFGPAVLALLVLAALLLGFFNRRARQVLGYALLLFVIPLAPLALGLGNKQMALFFPMRFFYLSGLGATLMVAAAILHQGSRHYLARLLLAGMALLLGVGGVMLSRDFSQWQRRQAGFLKAVAQTVLERYPTAPRGSIFYICTQPRDQALDTAAKIYYPELLDRYILLYCSPRTEIISRPEVVSAAAVPLQFDHNLRRNPMKIGPVVFGVTQTNPRRIEADADQPGVYVLEFPSEKDRVTDRFLPIGRPKAQ